MSSASLASSEPPAIGADVRRGRRTLLLLALVCLLPVLASYLAFYVWPPQGRVNHGRLIGPLALPAGTLAGAGGQPALAHEEFEGRWTLLVLAPGGCDAACTRALYVSRQARLAQAKEMERVGRVWLLSDANDVSAAALEGQAGLRLARADAAWLGALQATGGAEGGKVGGRLFLVDPLGNLMMVYPDEADTTAMARGVTKDLQRLLKYSGLGRG
jgi:hypothetical protein